MTKFFTENEIDITTSKINRLVKILKDNEISELLEIFETNYSSNEDSDIEKKNLDIKIDVGKNIFSYELFLSNYLKILLQFKNDIEQIDLRYKEKIQHINNYLEQLENNKE